uniref:hypothetical protein n=1 Tax=Mycobacterium sp. TaxID=1785 RepID=UPI003F9C516B
PSHLMPTKLMNANPKGGKHRKSQTPDDQDPTTAGRGNLTLTLKEPYPSGFVGNWNFYPTGATESAVVKLRCS